MACKSFFTGGSGRAGGASSHDPMQTAPGALGVVDEGEELRVHTALKLEEERALKREQERQSKKMGAGLGAVPGDDDDDDGGGPINPAMRAWADSLLHNQALLQGFPHGHTPDQAWPNSNLVDRAVTKACPVDSDSTSSTLGIAPLCYRSDLRGCADDACAMNGPTYNSLVAINEGQPWEKIVDSPEIDMDGNPQPYRFHCAFPIPLKEWPLASHHKTTLFQYDLSESCLTQGDLAVTMRCQPDSCGGVRIDPNALLLAIAPQTAQREMHGLLAPDDGDDRLHHAYITRVRIVGGQNSTDTSFAVRLEVPDVDVHDTSHNGKPAGFLPLSTAHGVCGSSTLQAVLPAGMRAGDLLQPPKRAEVFTIDTSPQSSTINSPEAARWREVDLQAVHEQIRVADLDLVGESRGTLRINAPISQHAALFPSDFLQFMVLTYMKELNVATLRLRVPGSSSATAALPTLQIRRTTTKSEVDGTDVVHESHMVVVLTAAMRDAVDYLYGLYGPTHRSGAVNLHMTQVALTPLQGGAQGWAEMLANSARDRKQGTERPVQLSVTLEVEFLSWDGPQRLTEAQKSRLLEPMAAYHKEYCSRFSSVRDRVLRHVGAFGAKCTADSAHVAASHA
jgi:hypothetical protein